MDLEVAIKRIKQKDNNAFEFIYHKTRSLVYAVIINIVKDHNTTEDLMQDTYIKMLQNINSYNEKFNFKTWLATIARNNAIDYYRKTKKEEIIDVSENENYFPHTKSNVTNEYNANYFLSFLDADEKEIVILRAMENFKFKDIAKIVNKPSGTVRWIYGEAMKKMKTHSKGVKL